LAGRSLLDGVAGIQQQGARPRSADRGRDGCSDGGQRRLATLALRPDFGRDLTGERFRIGSGAARGDDNGKTCAGAVGMGQAADKRGGGDIRRQRQPADYRGAQTGQPVARGRGPRPQ